MSTQRLTQSGWTSSFSLGGLENLWGYVYEGGLRIGWPRLVQLSEVSIVSHLQGIKQGNLKIITTRQTYEFKGYGARTAELRVVNDTFWLRLFTMGDLGFAEAYLYGDVKCNDLVTFFQILIDNRERITTYETKISALFTLPAKLAAKSCLNVIGNTRSNIAAHYDISNEMFSAILSRDMTYSSAIFEDLDGDLTSPDALGEALHFAQLRKMKHILRKARIQPGHHILDVGAGWGSMAILIAQTIPDTKIDALTLSVDQLEIAQERIEAAGLQERITFHLMDYRNMPPEWEGAFDRYVSIEMIEHVGKDFLETYWSTVDWALKKKGAAGVIQVITMPEARFEKYSKGVDFIQKWIFAGGFLPSLTFLLDAMYTGSKGAFNIDSICNIGPHYARTIREWRKNFSASFDEVIAPLLQKRYSDLMTGARADYELSVFKRKWIYYFCYCEAGFSTRTLNDHIVCFVREGCTEYGCNVYN